MDTRNLLRRNPHLLNQEIFNSVNLALSLIVTPSSEDV